MTLREKVEQVVFNSGLMHMVGDGGMKEFEYLVDAILAVVPKELERKIKILEKKLEVSKSNELKLCGDHQGKWHEKQNCVVCHTEHLIKKRIREEGTFGQRKLVLPERKGKPGEAIPVSGDSNNWMAESKGYINGWNACLAEIKKLNGGGE